MDDEEKHIKALVDYLGRYYLKTTLPRAFYDDVDVRTLPVWVLWLRGETDMPPLAARCVASIRKHAGGREVHVLSLDDLARFGVFMPDHVYDKAGEGSIAPEHFSDLVRLCLLERHGGTWLDATVLLTGPIPDAIVEEPFFAFRESTDDIYSAHMLFANGIMNAKPNHFFIHNLKNAMFRYWEREDAALHYHIFAFMAYGMILNNPVMTRIWLDCSQRSNAPVTALSRALVEPFDKDRLAAMADASAMHKLSSKQDDPIPGSFLDVLLRDGAAFGL